jgi:peptidyl-prolyl cis-trans isomerase C
MMKKALLFAIAAVLILSCGQKAAAPGAAPKVKKGGPVLARVGDEVLTKDELMILFRGQIPPDPPKDKLQAVLQSWVDGEVWTQEAMKLGIGQDETTQLALRNEERNLLARLFLSKIQDTIRVTDADIYDYYSKHKDDYTVSTSITYMMLYDSVLAAQIARRIKGGADFDATAREFSPDQVTLGEKTPYFVRNDSNIPMLRLSPDLNQAIFGLDKNQVSDAIKVGVQGKNTFWIIKCMDRRKVKQDVKFDEVKGTIAEELQPWKQQQVIESVTDVFKKRNKIEINVDNFYGGAKK